jgi:exportin-7
LQACGSCEKVIELTLTLFKDLTAGYMSGKVLTKLESVSYLLTNHNPQQYAFLQANPNSRNRTTFHATLARMIFVEDSSAKFVGFVKPLKDVLDGIAAASGGGTSAVALRQNVPENTVIGLFRDLHGIAQATLSRRAYMCASSPLFCSGLFQSIF